MTSKEYLINCHILLKYFELVFLQPHLVKILCKLIIIWVNYEKKTKRGPLWNTVYNTVNSHDPVFTQQLNCTIKRPSDFKEFASFAACRNTALYRHRGIFSNYCWNRVSRVIKARPPSDVAWQPEAMAGLLAQQTNCRHYGPVLYSTRQTGHAVSTTA